MLKVFMHGTAGYFYRVDASLVGFLKKYNYYKKHDEIMQITIEGGRIIHINPSYIIAVEEE